MSSYHSVIGLYGVVSFAPVSRVPPSSRPLCLTEARPIACNLARGFSHIVHQVSELDFLWPTPRFRVVNVNSSILSNVRMLTLNDELSKKPSSSRLSPYFLLAQLRDLRGRCRRACAQDPVLESRASCQSSPSRSVYGVAFGQEDGPRDDDEFLIRGNKDEKTDVVTAVNHGLDVVLQHKARNPVGGMVLVSEAADSTSRAHMSSHAPKQLLDVPIHSLGFRAHDPASLWLMSKSNQTSGTYTFVSDWYDLRECGASCVGGMMRGPTSIPGPTSDGLAS
ncbi:hypothetical protein FISHEDRAFT_76015 [Fistulina hepatica ATCC 64428]|uniref:Uncharacterized protein n=1 Tax=Fistulina hepatica ATCC 64428 TaxID=1128425 RepID=A0A0D7A719_9AGAR|nr:hypothetical protein FISHEDRAFT_76015 [Fistulina hepatica ATCC 64428]